MSIKKRLFLKLLESAAKNVIADNKKVFDELAKY